MRKARRGGERGKSTRLAFLAWGDFHARSCFARSTIPEEKWGLLVVYRDGWSSDFGLDTIRIMNRTAREVLKPLKS